MGIGRICFIVSLNRRFMAIMGVGILDPRDSNIFLLKGTRNVLVDTGLGFFPDALESRVESALGGSDLDMIVLTHCHVDHIGGLKPLMQKYGCEALAHPADAAHIRSGDSRYTLDEMFGRRLGPIDVGELEDGQVIDIGDHRLEVIHTPGHTEGCICLYDHVTKSLVSGDTVFKNGFGRTDFPGGSMSKMAGSLRALSRLDVLGIYPGHGDYSPDEGHDSIVYALRNAGVDIEDY